MSFFGKLKERLFRSSSKLEEGLDAIVEDGGEEDVFEAPSLEDQEGFGQSAISETILESLSEESQVETDEDAAPETGQVDAEIGRNAAAAEAHVPSVADEGAPAEERRVAPTSPTAPDALPNPEPAIELKPEPAPEPNVELAPEPDKAPLVEPDREPDTKPEPETAVVPKKAESEQLGKTPETRSERGTGQEETAKPGLIGRLLGRTGERVPKTVVRRVLDDDMLESLEELLITADMGVDTALRVTANMAEGRYGKKLSSQEIKELLATEVARIMEPVAKPLPLYTKTPQVVLVVGVNGSGKTTTIGKLASQFRAAGKQVVIAAGDTFRAAAVEQLQVWGNRAGVPVLTAPEGSDPASLAFDAMTKAEAEGADLLMIDTAGRLQNRADLMEELAKIVRVIRKKDETAPHNTLLVLDATTGQNALNQVDIFQKIADVSGLVMTKLDGTAKGGVLVALADKFGLPIHAIGVGEQIDDLAPFDPDEFAQALTGGGQG